MTKTKKEKLRKIQEERLSQFDQEIDHYEEKDMGGEVWVKSYNGGTGRWQVAVFSKKSFRAYKGYWEAKDGFENAISKDD